MIQRRPSGVLLGLCLLLLLLPAAGMGKDGVEETPILRIKGSDTLIKVLRAWKRGYYEHQLAERRQKGPLRVQGEVVTLPPPLTNVAVDGGGSGNGIAALINGHVDIASSSRPIKEQELRVLARRTRTTTVARTVGWDAVVMVVARNNPLKGLRVDQLQGIYGAGGEVRSWGQTGVAVPGCPGGRILFFSRKNNSGTYAVFHDFILSRHGQFHPDMVSLDSTSQIIDRVSVSPCAIGYTGMAYVDERVKPLCLLPSAGEPCVPASEVSVRNHAYPLSRPLLLYTLGEPQGEARSFLDWVVGPDGQKILQDEGYIPLQSAPTP